MTPRPNTPASQPGTGRTDSGSSTSVRAADSAINIPLAITPDKPSHPDRADNHVGPRDLARDVLKSNAPPRDVAPGGSLTVASKIMPA